MDFQNMLDQFNTQDSYFILVFMLLAFLFGLLIGFLLRTGKVLALKREIRTNKKEIEELHSENSKIQEQLKLKTADLKKVSFELTELEAKVKRLEGEKATLYNDTYALNARLEKARMANNTYISTIEDLNSQILSLNTQHNLEGGNLAGESSRGSSSTESLPIYDNRLTNMENMLSQLSEENKYLRIAVDGLKASNISGSNMVAEEDEEKTEEEDPEFIIDNNPAIGARIIEEEREKDDLSLIEGIGPFIEQQLNESGIYTYEQISQLDQESIDQLTEKIGYLPGRIEKDDWVGQAKKLYETQLGEPLELEPLSKDLFQPNDLKIIEGVGPKIEEVLKENGIHSWTDLAEKEAPEIREILDSAGDHFKVHDPATWPAQARLALNGEWDLLKDYQEELKGGKKVT